MWTTREPSWQPVLDAFATTPEAQQLATFLAAEAADDILPDRADWFQALELCPLPAVRVVILGSEPNPVPGETCGLAFSGPSDTEPSSTLANVRSNLREVAGLTPPPDADLRGWAQQGVLLLNRCLTVRMHAPGSHRQQGWEALTLRLLRAVNALPHTVAFLLWGRDAQQAARDAGLDRARHTLLATSHPSPKAAKYGFAKANPFGQVHTLQDALGQPRLDWGRAYDPAAGSAPPVPGESTPEDDDGDDEEEVESAVYPPPAKRRRTAVMTAALWTTGQPGVEQAAVRWLHGTAPPAVQATWAIRGVVPVRARALDGSRWPEATSMHHMPAVNPMGHVATELAAAWRAVLTQVAGVLVIEGPATKAHPALPALVRGARQQHKPVHVVSDVTADTVPTSVRAWVRTLRAPSIAVTGAYGLTPEAQRELAVCLTCLTEEASGGGGDNS